MFCLAVTASSDQQGSIPFQLNQPVKLKGSLNTTLTFVVEDSPFQKGKKNLVAQIDVRSRSSAPKFWGLKIELLRKDGSACDPQQRSMTFLREKSVRKGQDDQASNMWSLDKFTPADVGKVNVHYVESSKPLPDNAIP